MIVTLSELKGPVIADNTFVKRYTDAQLCHDPYILIGDLAMGYHDIISEYRI
jgi:hypothetical protein